MDVVGIADGMVGRVTATEEVDTADLGDHTEATVSRKGGCISYIVGTFLLPLLLEKDYLIFE